MKQLEVLEVSETKITGQGIAELAGLQNLKRLFLAGLDVTPGEVDELRQAMPHCTITWWKQPVIENPQENRR